MAIRRSAAIQAYILALMDASFDTIPIQAGQQGEVGSFDVAPYINDGIPSGWTLSLDPDDITITSFVTLSGTLLTWTPPVPDLDTDRLYSILLVLTHPTDPAVEVCAFVFLSVPAMSLVVSPEWRAVPVHSGQPGSMFSLNLNNFVTGNPIPTIALETGTLGSYDLSDGVFSGTRPDTTGSQDFTFEATNSQGDDISGTVRITTALAPPPPPPPILIAPVIASIGNLSRTSGYSSFTIQASLSSGSSVTWSISGITGATISSSGLITIPAGLSVGGYSATVTAQNSAGSDTEPFIVSVTTTQPPPPPPLLPPVSGGTYSFNIDTDVPTTIRASNLVSGTTWADADLTISVTNGLLSDPNVPDIVGSGSLVSPSTQYYDNGTDNARVDLTTTVSSNQGPGSTNYCTITITNGTESITITGIWTLISD